MKKLLLSLLACAVVLTGCGTTDNTDDTTNNDNLETTVVKTEVNVGALQGPTGLGMANLAAADEAEETANDYTFTIAGSADLLLPELIQGNLDIVALPSNTAALLYNNESVDLQILAVNTLGILHILENGNTITSIEDLRGKTIYASGIGTTAEYSLTYILEANGLTIGEDVFVEYKSEHSELASLVIAGEVEVAVLPEPFVTQVLAANEDINQVLDLTEEWNNIETSEGQLILGCVVATADFIAENPEAVAIFMEEYEASIIAANADPATTAVYSETYGILAASVAEAAIPNCNIVYIDGEDMATDLSGFYNVLYNANPDSIGGQIPDDGIFYQK